MHSLDRCFTYDFDNYLYSEDLFLTGNSRDRGFFVHFPDEYFDSFYFDLIGENAFIGYFPHLEGWNYGSFS